MWDFTGNDKWVLCCSTEGAKKISLQSKLKLTHGIEVSETVLACLHWHKMAKEYSEFKETKQVQRNMLSKSVT